MRRMSGKWQTEAAMFACLQDEARAQGFSVYPECDGHDLVLQVREPRDELEAGDLVVVEGKLHDNVKVLAQALPPSRRWGSENISGGHWHCVAVPGASQEFERVAWAAGIHVIRVLASGMVRWPRWQHELRHDPGLLISVPDVEVIMVAGHPAPRAVTRWKLAAVELCLLALRRPRREVRGSDFRSFGLHATLWLDRCWIRRTGTDGRYAVYALQDVETRPDLEYPEIAAALRAGGQG